MLWGIVYVILLLILKKENRIKSFLLIILTGLFGLGLSAFFWLPAFGERNFIRLAGITQGFFDFRHNFITFSELIALPQALDLSAINPYYPSSLGIAQITFFILAMLVFSYVVIVKLMSDAPVDVHGETKLALSLQLLTPIFFLMALIFYSFMTLPQSQWLWENIPLVSLTEFPWRMLGPAIFCVAVLAGATAHVVGQVFCQEHQHLHKQSATKFNQELSAQQAQANFYQNGLTITLLLRYYYPIIHQVACLPNLTLPHYLMAAQQPC
ncbi:MAG: hypothetical protein B6242_01520 [Anaerolineaceae bacterium 4572_78]|nr:MAG: hypothetical protein B6242_01520 [Anaerolineaceae bacterium 4572_78]